MCFIMFMNRDAMCVASRSSLYRAVILAVSCNLKCEVDVSDAEDGDIIDDTDSDIGDAWSHYDQQDRKVSTLHNRAQARFELPREIARGYIVLGDKRIGRIACQPRPLPNPSIHVACYSHSCCSAWIELKRVPDTRLVRVWMAKAHEFESSEAHWEAGMFVIVCNRLGCCSEWGGVVID